VKTDQIKSDVRTITPEQAAVWIAEQINNRHLSAKTVKNYQGDLDAGRWKINGDTIKFAQSGKLIDGQHRLVACIRSKKSFESIVVHGIDDAALHTIDVGRRRTGSDILKLRGENNTNLLSASLNVMVAYETKTIGPNRPTPTSSDREDCLIRHPGIRASVDRIKGAPKGIRSASIAFVDYAGRLSDEERTESFIYQLLSGFEVTQASPAFHLRGALTDVDDEANTSRIYRLAISIKALNTALADKEMRVLTFGKEEPFPSVTYTEYGKPIKAVRG
jgi:hypothetical protein